MFICNVKNQADHKKSKKRQGQMTSKSTSQRTTFLCKINKVLKKTRKR